MLPSEAQNPSLIHKFCMDPSSFKLTSPLSFLVQGGICVLWWIKEKQKDEKVTASDVSKEVFKEASVSTYVYIRFVRTYSCEYI